MATVETEALRKADHTFVRLWWITMAVIAVAVMVFAVTTAAAQSSAPPPERSSSRDSHEKQLTVRLHIGPNLNTMKDWRDGLQTLQGIARSRNLRTTDSDNSGIGGSYGGTILAKVTETIGVGIEVEFLRDENSFLVQDVIGGLFAGTGHFVTSVDAFSRGVQVVAAVHPWTRQRRAFFQLGLGIGSGRVRFFSPGGRAEGEGTGVILSGLVGTDLGVLHLSGGVRLHRFGIDYEIQYSGTGPARYWFSSEAEARSFSQGRDVDFTGLFLRIGVAVHLIKS